MTTQQLARYSFWTVLVIGTAIVLLMMSGCAVSPNIKPADYITPTGHYLEASPGMSAGWGYKLDDAYFPAAAARTKLQHDERWAAFWCDIGSTGLALATGGGSELWGNATLLVKVPVGYVVQRKMVRDAENGHPAGLGVINTLHWGACLWNLSLL